LGLKLVFGAVALAEAKAKFGIVVVSRNADTDRLRDLARDSGVNDGTIEFVSGPKYSENLLTTCSALAYPFAPSVGTPQDIDRARDAGIRIMSVGEFQAARDSVGGDESDLLIKTDDVEGFAEAILQVVWDQEYADESDRSGRVLEGNT
jgi:glycosyltransferase involved in cell wall biosynthesis